MRRRAIPVVAALATLAGAGPAGAAPAQVSIPGRFFAPPRVEVLVGESVTWTNRDFFDHDIAADDGSFGSAAMTSRGVFAHTFTATGVHTYYCRIHPTMRGQVDVFAFALRGPPSSVPAGRAAVLRGLAPAGTAAVTIERLEAGAFRAVAAAAVSPTGAFRATVVPAGPVVYRAVAGAATSASLALPVSVRVRVTLRRLRGGRVELRAAASPAQAGVPAALQVYSRERFAWRQVDHGRLDGRSTVRFRLSDPARRLKARVVLLRGVGGYAPAIGDVTIVRPLRPRSR